MENISMDKQIKKDNLIFIFLAVVCVLITYFGRLGSLFDLGFILFLLYKKQWKLLGGIFLFVLIDIILDALIGYATMRDLMMSRTICFWGNLSFVLLIYKQFRWMLATLVLGVVIFVLTDYNKYDTPYFYHIEKTVDNNEINKP